MIPFSGLWQQPCRVVAMLSGEKKPTCTKDVYLSAARPSSLKIRRFPPPPHEGLGFIAVQGLLLS
jgi:hypothetical protein